VNLPLLTSNGNAPLSGCGAIDLIAGLVMVLFVIFVSQIAVIRVIVSRRTIPEANQSEYDDSRSRVDFMSDRNSDTDIMAQTNRF
jgi:hypothetical protein